MSSSAGSSAFQASRASKPALARGRKLRPSLKVVWREGKRSGKKGEGRNEERRRGSKVGMRESGQLAAQKDPHIIGPYSCEIYRYIHSI